MAKKNALPNASACLPHKVKDGMLKDNLENERYSLNLPTMAGSRYQPPPVAVAICYAESQHWLSIKATQEKLEKRWTNVSNRVGMPFAL